MTNLIVEVSKYLMILLMAIYTYANFRFFSFPDLERKRKVCARQNRAMFLLHFLAYLVMYLKTEDETLSRMLLVFYIGQVVFFLLYIYIYRFIYRNVSRLLVNNCCMLLACGFIMLTRLSLDKGLDKAFKQFVIVAAAAVVSWLVPFIMERFWQLYKFQWLYGGIGLAALLLVWVAGNESFGAQLSLTIGGISIQPSEFVKISFVFFVASMFYQSLEFKNICITTVVAALHVVILVLSKDLGSALIFFHQLCDHAVYCYRKLAVSDRGRCSWKNGATSIAYTLFRPCKTKIYSMEKTPWADIDNTGYQITQSLFAIGTGGWFGMGLCQGMPNRIPVVEKDFHFCCYLRRNGSNLCYLRPSDLSGLFYPVYDDRNPDAGHVLQDHCSGSWNGICGTGLSHSGRCD